MKKLLRENKGHTLLLVLLTVSLQCIVDVVSFLENKKGSLKKCINKHINKAAIHLLKKLPCKRQGYRTVWCTDFFCNLYNILPHLHFLNLSLLSFLFSLCLSIFLLSWQLILFTAYSEAVT